MKRHLHLLKIVPFLPALFAAGSLALAPPAWGADPVNRGVILFYSYGPGLVQITGPEGSRAGADLFSGRELAEMRGSDVSVERAKDRSDGWTVTLNGPDPGIYRLDISGTGTGRVVIDLEIRDGSGRVSRGHILRKVRAGVSLSYTLDYNPHNRDDIRLEEIKN